jgi:heme/copper-type cytochrome/quinol oxidase subunit 2
MAANENTVSGTGHSFEIVVQRGMRVSGPAVLKVNQGDEVTLHITTDTADEFHLHGYNLFLQLSPNNTATLHLIAKLTGRFTYELHKSGVELGALEVYPR